ncbi:MAG: DUF1801 domain-containing protein [Acidimicrobiales bacterium]|nr:DUF1801 domain-containing protein [Acidimicrobiia bacterium]NNF56349.1 DUF1801 domain-containing protein [Acidimicrobiales bacterium]NNL69436.1 DUF1801 domain-containing protein [Acidimicrobiia bacterium]
MAEAAGIVNDGGLDNNVEFQKLIESVPPAVQEIAEAVRRLVYDVLPKTVEVIWHRQGSVGWGTGPKKFTEQFAYMMCYSRHVTLGFYRGGELSDPAGLLPGTGNTQVAGTLSMRSLKLKSVQDVDQSALRALIEEATKRGVPPSGD